MEPDAHDRTADRLRDALDARPEDVQRVVKAALDAPRVNAGAPWLVALAALVLTAVAYTGVGKFTEPEAFRIVGDDKGVFLLRPDGTTVQALRSEEPGSILIVVTSGGDREHP
jgi:hypothetical protein